MMPDQAEKGDRVRVHYTGRLADGQVFDSSEGGDPLEFEIGAGQVIEGFDQGVREMNLGGKKTIIIEADQAYGQRNDALIQQVSRASINLDAEPQVGMNLIMQLPDNNQIPITITEVTPDTITLDANHPLAGSQLTFEVELVGIQKQGEQQG
ncbi:MAG TPA: peptidylprolyl isomerase [Pyrinomonadaceae bacterium]|nr:peptidylprolyl isomerase [Pyrinomonadaceae bacterium]